MCLLKDNVTGIPQFTYDWNSNMWFFWLIMASTASSMAFFIIVYRTKELFEVHPINIIMYSQLAESFGFICYAMLYRICDFRLYEFFALTVFFSKDLRDQAIALDKLKNSIQFMAYYVENISINLNTILCVDMVLMIRYPFESKESRLPKYMAYSVLIPLIPSILFLNRGEHGIFEVVTWITVTFMCLFLFCFLLSVIYTCRKLNGPGMSKQVRQLVMKRHIITLVAYIIAYYYLISFQIIFAFADDEKRQEMFTGSHFWLYKVLKLITACNGFYIPILRFSEPAFFNTLKKKFCSKKKSSDEQEEEVEAE